MSKYFKEVCENLGYTQDENLIKETVKNRHEYNRITGETEDFVNMINMLISKRVGFYVGEIEINSQNAKNREEVRKYFGDYGRNLFRTIATATLISMECALCYNWVNRRSSIRAVDDYAKVQKYTSERGIYLEKFIYFEGTIAENEIYIEYVKENEDVFVNYYSVNKKEFNKTYTEKITAKKIPAQFFTQINQIDLTTQKRPLVSYLINYNNEYNKLKEYANKITELSAVPITILMDIENTNSQINSVKPGALWDLQSQYGENKQGKIERIQGDSEFLRVLEEKKTEILNNMYLATSLPSPYNTSQITTTSGKALTIQYWELLGEVNMAISRWGRDVSKYINNIANWDGENAVTLRVKSALQPLLDLENRKDKLEEIRMGILSKKTYALEKGLNWELENERMKEEEYNQDDPNNFY